MNGFVPARWSAVKTNVIAGFLFLAFCVYAIPQFLRMPLTNDAHMYDLQVRLLFEGGVLYRDILEPNLPGVVWVQSLVRMTLGWSSESLRMFDLLMLAGTCWLISRWFKVQDWNAAGRIAIIFAVCGFYVSQSEWCHCQRDGWMLFPMFGALILRRRVSLEFRDPGSSSKNIFFLAMAEGLLWGMAIWLKPHVLIPAACIWGVGAMAVRPGKRAVIDVLGLLTGGLLVGMIGILWMLRHDCWLPFWETARQWNPRYFAAGREQWTLPRFLAAAWRLSPWMFLHIPAVVIALRSILRAVRWQNRDTHSLSRALLGACYLGLTVQAFFLQHLFDYIHAAPLFLAIVVVASWIHGYWAASWCRAVAIGFLGLAIAMSPLADGKQAKFWWTAVTTPAHPILYDQLKSFDNPRWEDLDRVCAFLAEQNPAPKDVCCFQSDLVPIYNRLNLLPPTRIVYVQEILVYFPDRREAIYNSLKAAPHRFVVTNLGGDVLTPEQIDRLLSPEYQASLSKPAKKPRLYPWGYPIVFRAGDYLVHEVPTEPHGK